MTTPSFSPPGSVTCHRCRFTSGTGAADPSNHVCSLSSSLYVARVTTPSELFDNYQLYVGGFTLPSVFVETGFTNFPCPIEMIVTSPGGDFVKIGHGCAPSGPFYVYMKRDGSCSLAFYRVNGARISTRVIPSISSLAVHFNAPTASVVPQNPFTGFQGSSNLPPP